MKETKCFYCNGEGRTWRSALGRPAYMGACDYCKSTGVIWVQDENQEEQKNPEEEK